VVRRRVSTQWPRPVGILVQRYRKLCFCRSRDMAGFRDSIRPYSCDLGSLIMSPLLSSLEVHLRA
jgi:hypothetical protein